MSDLAAIHDDVERAWEKRESLNPKSKGRACEAVDQAIELLDSGRFRVAEKDPKTGLWHTNAWLKKAVLLSFRLHPNQVMHTGRGLFEHAAVGPWWDKVPNKLATWSEAKFTEAGFRAVPGAIVRKGAYVARNVVLMPSFVNIGAYVDEGTMVDTWATVGSCAQIGKNVHISGGAGIGGVLEPLQASPTIIEDNCFIGARSEVAEGVVVGEGAVLSMGVFISASTKVVDRLTGEIVMGRVPPYAVVVPGALPHPQGGPALACAVIVKRVDAKTRAKTSINDLLRD